MSLESKTITSKEILLFWLPLAGYMALIFTLSSIPGENLELPGFWNSDKLLHVIEYAVLGILWLRVLKGVHKKGERRLLFAFLLTLLYGVTDETHQYFVDGRFAAAGDVVADGVGAWLGPWLYNRIFLA